MTVGDGYGRMPVQLVATGHINGSRSGVDRIRARLLALRSVGINGFGLYRLVIKCPSVLIAEEIDSVISFDRDELEGKVEPAQLERLFITTAARFLLGFDHKVKMLIRHEVPREKIAHVLNNVNLNKAICCNFLKNSAEAKQMPLGRDREIFKIILVFPNVISASKERKLRPRIEFLKHCGLDSNDILKTKEFAAALSAVTRTSCENMQKEIGLFLSYGLSYEDIFYMSKKHPQILQYNPSSLEEKMVYLTEDMGRDIRELLTFPAFLGYKLYDRIKHRYEVKKKTAGTGMSLNNLLSESANRFSTRKKAEMERRYELPFWCVIKSCRFPHRHPAELFDPQFETQKEYQGMRRRPFFFIADSSRNVVSSSTGVYMGKSQHHDVELLTRTHHDMLVTVLGRFIDFGNYKLNFVNYGSQETPKDSLAFSSKYGFSGLKAKILWENLGRVPESFNGGRIPLNWLDANFRDLSEDASEDEVKLYARACILQLIGGLLMPDKSRNQVHCMWLRHLSDFHLAGSFSWGSTVLALLYKEMCQAIDYRRNAIGGCLLLLQSWAWYRLPFFMSRCEEPIRISTTPEFEFVSYSTDDVRGVIPPELKGPLDVWMAMVPLICYAIVEWHSTDRMLQQFGCFQPITEVPHNMDELYNADRRGKTDTDWLVRHHEWVMLWEDQHRRLPRREPIFDDLLMVADGYYEWFNSNGKPFMLSEDARGQTFLRRRQRRSPAQHHRPPTHGRRVDAAAAFTWFYDPAAATVADDPSWRLLWVYAGGIVSHTPLGPLFYGGASSSSVPHQPIVPTQEEEDNDDNDDGDDDDSEESQPVIRRNPPRDRQPPPCGTHSHLL
ncbi:putative Subtilase family protein [Hibiscus syriacus]|uniref:Subtilase family protein n=1 Tax=Hibiscus syriacus TaxID=106335 RepID=A0A6A3AMB5_HIBSY|nr:putative Subtilase family protein [Hibiscus syriacus]